MAGSTAVAATKGRPMGGDDAPEAGAGATDAPGGADNNFMVDATKHDGLVRLFSLSATSPVVTRAQPKDGASI
eukprot:5022422-Karenia_brevis.AAC.1